MFEYIIGKVINQESNYIVLENNKIGYLIYTANPYIFKLDDEIKVYIYQQVREDENSLYGFKDKESKELFLKLIGVKGLGCKMALPMLATGSTDEIKNAIDSEDVNYLKKFPKIGDKVAKQIILDLKGKLTCEVKTSNSEEIKEALLALGYKNNDITKIISKIDNTLTIEKQIKEALKLLLK